MPRKLIDDVKLLKKATTTQGSAKKTLERTEILSHENRNSVKICNTWFPESMVEGFSQSRTEKAMAISAPLAVTAILSTSPGTCINDLLVASSNPIFSFGTAGILGILIYSYLNSLTTMLYLLVMSSYKQGKVHKISLAFITGNPRIIIKIHNIGQNTGRWH